MWQGSASHKQGASEKRRRRIPGQPKLQQVIEEMNRKYLLVPSTLTSLLLIIASTFSLAQRSLEIPSGTSIRVRMTDNSSSEQTQMGDTFRRTWTSRLW